LKSIPLEQGLIPVTWVVQLQCRAETSYQRVSRSSGPEHWTLRLCVGIYIHIYTFTLHHHYIIWISATCAYSCNL